MRPCEQKNSPYLDGILHKHANQAIDIFLSRNFEVRVDLVNQGFHAKDEEWECCLQNLVHFLDMIPGATEGSRRSSSLRLCCGLGGGLCGCAIHYRGSIRGW